MTMNLNTEVILVMKTAGEDRDDTTWRRIVGMA